MADEENVISEEDVLQEQMRDTRTAISEKLEKLEQKMVDSTVKAVGGSVGAVLETTTAVKETVDSVKDTVQDTVNSVKEFAQAGVENLRELLDLRLQTQRHPWLVLGGSVAAGFCLERLLFGSRSRAMKTALPPPSSGKPARQTGTQRNGGYRERREQPESPSLVMTWLKSLTERFGPELDQMKGVAFGTMLSLARDLVARAVPPEWEGQVADTFNRVAEKMHLEIVDRPAGTTSGAAFTARPEPVAETGFGRAGQRPERATGRFEGT